MLLKSNAARLTETLRGVETMTRFALAVLSLASGVYTYLGVRGLLDGSPTFVFFGAIIYAAAVSVAIYAFWTFFLRFVPLVTHIGQRLMLFLVMAIGCLMIMAMSSWLNAAALAGSAALEQHLAETLSGYAGDLDDAHANALASQSLLPDVQRASDRFAKLAADERDTGALSGTTGSGSVVQLLTQMSTQMDELGKTITGSQVKVGALFDEGSAHLKAMRDLLSAGGEIGPRSDQFSAEVVQLAAVIAALQETSVAPSVKRAAADLSLGFIAPVANGTTVDLQTRQDQAMESVKASVAAQSQALSEAADKILAQPQAAQRKFQPLSSAEAVLRYWQDFIPSWAGAISIDLLPVVLVLVLMVVNDAMRRELGELSDADSISAGEMLRAMALYRQMAATAEPAIAALPLDGVTPATTAPAAPVPTVAAASDGDATVTPIDVGQRKRGDGPLRP
jgi:hypothetical protein